MVERAKDFWSDWAECDTVLLKIMHPIVMPMLWFMELHYWIFEKLGWYDPNDQTNNNFARKEFIAFMDEFAAIKGIMASEYEIPVEEYLKHVDNDKEFDRWHKSLPKPDPKLKIKVLDMTRQAEGMAVSRFELRMIDEFVSKLENSLQEVAREHLHNVGFYEEVVKETNEWGFGAWLFLIYVILFFTYVVPPVSKYIAMAMYYPLEFIFPNVFPLN